MNTELLTAIGGAIIERAATLGLTFEQALYLAGAIWEEAELAA